MILLENKKRSIAQIFFLSDLKAPERCVAPPHGHPNMEVAAAAGGERGTWSS